MRTRRCLVGRSRRCRMPLAPRGERELRELGVLHPGRSGAARVDEQRAKPLARVGGRGLANREGEAVASRLRVVDRDLERARTRGRCRRHTASSRPAGCRRARERRDSRCPPTPRGPAWRGSRRRARSVSRTRQGRSPPRVHASPATGSEARNAPQTASSVAASRAITAIAATTLRTVDPIGPSGPAACPRPGRGWELGRQGGIRARRPLRKVLGARFVVQHVSPSAGKRPCT